MTRTEYAVLTTDELINFCDMKANKTPLETELTLRLTGAVEMLASIYGDDCINRAERFLS